MSQTTEYVKNKLRISHDLTLTYIAVTPISMLQDATEKGAGS